MSYTRIVPSSITEAVAAIKTTSTLEKTAYKGAKDLCLLLFPLSLILQSKSLVGRNKHMPQQLVSTGSTCIDFSCC